MAYKDPATGALHQAQYYKDNRARIRDYQRQYYLKNQEKLKQRQRDYHAAEDKDERAAKDHARYEANKPRLAALNAVWRKENAESLKVSKHLDYEARKAADPEFQERCRISNRRSYRLHRLKRLKKGAEWAKANPDSKHASRIRRRIRLLAVQVSIEKVDREAIIKRDKSICHICQKRVVRKDLTLDHLIPLFHGGPDTAANLAVAHRSCNASRGTGRIAAQLRLFG
jgi:5-methylcytosine-specific restriction endonuclease McrA